ncbi:nitronate monooxygenase [Microbacterium sp. P05]|uniref:nitronate monooxygenase n=1 Tax=Microbacterium sp. P05 TaxID=3366948 RepID=UPI0037458364
MKTVLPELLRERVPVFAAPMAGGPSTPELVAASAAAGHFAQLAGGYRTTREMSEQIGAVRAEGALFGINLFVPTVGAQTRQNTDAIGIGCALSRNGSVSQLSRHSARTTTRGQRKLTC